jgi:hypothetical protein
MIGYYRLATPSMVFYLRRSIFEYYAEEDVISAFSSEREVYCLMTESDYDAMKASLPPGTYILAVRPLFQVKLRGIFERKRGTQAVLVTNKVRTGDLK